MALEWLKLADAILHPTDDLGACAFAVESLSRAT
jgi:hypothetical protein